MLSRIHEEHTHDLHAQANNFGHLGQVRREERRSVDYHGGWKVKDR
jgi:hypothetical protein